MDIAAIYLLNAFAAAYLLYAWQNSHLPALMFWILRLLQFKRKNYQFWTVPGEEGLGMDANGVFHPRTPLSWTHRDFELFCDQRLPLFFGLLFQCKICISMHISFWVNLVAFTVAKLCGILDIGWLTLGYTVLLSAFSIAFLGLFFYMVLRRLDK